VRSTRRATAGRRQAGPDKRSPSSPARWITRKFRAAALKTARSVPAPRQASLANAAGLPDPSHTLNSPRIL
jgi:hypothetical protein